MTNPVQGGGSKTPQPPPQNQSKANDKGPRGAANASEGQSVGRTQPAGRSALSGNNPGSASQAQSVRGQDTFSRTPQNAGNANNNPISAPQRNPQPPSASAPSPAPAGSGITNNNNNAGGTITNNNDNRGANNNNNNNHNAPEPQQADSPFYDNPSSANATGNHNNNGPDANQGANTFNNGGASGSESTGGSGAENASASNASSDGLADLGSILQQFEPLLQQLGLGELFSALRQQFGGGSASGPQSNGSNAASGSGSANASPSPANASGSTGSGASGATSSSDGASGSGGASGASGSTSSSGGASGAQNPSGGSNLDNLQLDLPAERPTIDRSLVPEGGLNAGNIEEYAEKLSKKFGFPKELILAQVQKESGPDFSDLGHEGDTSRGPQEGGHSLGPNQITEGVLQGGIWSGGGDGIDLSPEEARSNPALAMQAGLIHLYDYTQQAGGDIKKGLSKYVGHDEADYLGAINNHLAQWTS